jgi:hypothetical protein
VSLHGKKKKKNSPKADKNRMNNKEVKQRDRMNDREAEQQVLISQFPQTSAVNKKRRNNPTANQYSPR